MARALDKRKYVQIPVEAEQEVIDLYQAGWSANRIRFKFDTSLSPICRVLKKHGVILGRKGRPTKLIPEIKSTALAVFAAGASGKEAAEAAGISASSMSELLKQEGIPSRRDVREFTESEELEIVERYKAGEAGADIGADYGVFHKRIYSVLEARGVGRRAPPKHPWTDRRGREFILRSRWELEVARYLDELRCDWNYEEVRYQLLDGQKKRRYTPDFWVYEGANLVAIIEVKGRWFGDQRYRIDLLSKQYPRLPLVIWDAKVLRKLGILDRISYPMKAT